MQAQLTTNSLYTYTVPLTAQSCKGGINPTNGVSIKQYAPCDFHTKNMSDILLRLREIFPGCVVKFSLLVKGKDGKMYDVDTMHEEALPFIDMKDSNEFITIDWS